jgi:hypothetical protein
VLEQWIRDADHEEVKAVEEDAERSEEPEAPVTRRHRRVVDRLTKRRAPLLSYGHGGDHYMNKLR